MCGQERDDSWSPAPVSSPPSPTVTGDDLRGNQRRRAIARRIPTTSPLAAPAPPPLPLLPLAAPAPPASTAPSTPVCPAVDHSPSELRELRRRSSAWVTAAGRGRRRWGRFGKKKGIIRWQAVDDEIVDEFSTEARLVDPDRIVKFEVFEADLASVPGRWIKVDSLYSHAIFISSVCSKSVIASQYAGGVQEDCIYFMHRVFDNPSNECLGQSVDPLADNMRDGKFMALLPEVVIYSRTAGQKLLSDVVLPADA